MCFLQCVTLTGCGNFAILGMSSGHIEVFNVQSGIHRGEIGRPKGMYICACIIMQVNVVGERVLG